MIYGTVKFDRAGLELTAELTEVGWRVSGPELSGDVLASLADMLNESCSPSGLSPAAGDPIRFSIARAAKLFYGTYSLAVLNPAPADAIF